MSKDWLFRDDTSLCNVRVAGVLLRNGKLLLQRDKNGTEYALPGGHVQIGEETQNALKREFREEMGIDIDIDRLLWTEECFWQWGQRQAHTFTFYYLIHGDLPDAGNLVPHLDNEQVLCEYLLPEALHTVTVYPAFLKNEIFLLNTVPKHFVTYD